MTEHSEATSPTRQFAPLAIIAAIPLLFAAVFFYTSPVVLETGGEQGIFKCGSPSSPNSDAKNVCAQPEKVERNKAIYSGLTGAGLLGLGAVWMLRGQRRDEWDEDEDGPRRWRDDDELRGDRDRGRGDALRGAPERRSRRDDDLDEEPGRRSRRDDDLDEEPGRRSRRDDDLDEAPERRSRRDDDLESEPEETRSSRRGRRSLLRDDDFADPPARRRGDDDWSSDGWR